MPGAVAQSLAATALGAVVGWAFGWGWSAGLVYGMAVSVASTVVLIRVLSDNNRLVLYYLPEAAKQAKGGR